jgi:SRSO17 transposase
MTPDDVRATAEQLVPFHEQFAPLFGKDPAQDHAFTYLTGLMACPERKSIEPIALNVGAGRVKGLQKFIAVAPWQYDDVQAEIQATFAERLAPSAASTPIGVVGVIDESAFAKKGTESAGVARQHNGRLGKEDNCQVGVFLVGVTPAGTALLDHQLYLPASWYEGDSAAARRAKVHIPEGQAFQTKSEIAATLVRNVTVVGAVEFDWITADEEYGKNGELLDELERLERRYVMEVPRNTTVWTVDPMSCVPQYSGLGRPASRPTREAVRGVDAIAADLPAEAWRALQVREGATGPLVFEFATVRVWAVRHRRPGPPIWLLIRRSLEETPEVKYYVSNGGAETTREVLALVAWSRHRVEEFLEDAKSYLGMAQYETRSWVGWHHHMTLVGLAHLFVTLMRLRLKKKTPKLTLDRTVRLLEAALAEPMLSVTLAIALVEYHIRRNKIAKASHDKTWKEKHGGVIFLRL